MSAVITVHATQPTTVQTIFPDTDMVVVTSGPVTPVMPVVYLQLCNLQQINITVTGQVVVNVTGCSENADIYLTNEGYLNLDFVAKTTTINLNNKSTYITFCSATASTKYAFYGTTETLYCDGKLPTTVIMRGVFKETIFDCSSAAQ